MGKFEDAQDTRRPFIEALHKLGIPGSWICEKIKLNPITFRRDLTRFGIDNLPRKTRQEAYATALQCYARIINGMGADVDFSVWHEVKVLIADWLGLEAIEKERGTLDAVAKILHKPEIKEEDKGYLRLLNVLLNFKDDTLSPTWSLWQDILKDYSTIEISTLPTDLKGVLEELRRRWVRMNRRTIGVIWKGHYKASDVFDRVLNTLTPREEQVIRMYYGINSEPRDTIAIGMEFQATKERVQQILVKAIHKLQHPSRLCKLSRLYHLQPFLKPEMISRHFSDEVAADVSNLRAEITKLKSELAEALAIISEKPILSERYQNRDSIDERARFNEALYKRVSELELSVRTFNCLKNAGIKYVGELVTRSEAQLLKSQGFGRKSLKEVRDVLLEFGFTLDMVLVNFPDPSILRLFEEPREES